MKANDAPKKHNTPFGVNGPREDILADTPSGSNQASYDDGFPAITMTLKSAGGLPPKGQDMNQILFELSSQGRYLSAGGGYPFDAGFAISLGGYPKGALIPNSTASGCWLNTVDDNSTNPENATAALTGWVPVDSYGITTISGLAASGVTLTTLQAAKDKIVLSGTLTANINLVFPAWIKGWRIENNCTGNFTVTVKTPSGNGVAISSGTTALVQGDGVNINSATLAGMLINVTSITASGSYTPTTGTKRVYVELVGGGGGGGYGGTSNVGQGGGGGGVLKKLLPVSGAVAVTVGVGGAGGTSSVQAAAGGATSFGIYTVTGGSGGGFNGTSGGAGGSSTSGDINIAGGQGAGGISISGSTSYLGGFGGSVPGYGSAPGYTQNGNGVSSQGYGSGGGGGSANGSGAAGKNGIIVIWEYS